MCDWGWEGSLQCVIGGGRVVYNCMCAVHASSCMYGRGR